MNENTIVLERDIVTLQTYLMTPPNVQRNEIFIRKLKQAIRDVLPTLQCVFIEQEASKARQLAFDEAVTPIEITEAEREAVAISA